MPQTEITHKTGDRTMSITHAWSALPNGHRYADVYGYEELFRACEACAAMHFSNGDGLPVATAEIDGTPMAATYYSAYGDAIASGHVPMPTGHSSTQCPGVRA